MNLENEFKFDDFVFKIAPTELNKFAVKIYILFLPVLSTFMSFQIEQIIFRKVHLTLSVLE